MTPRPPGSPTTPKAAAAALKANRQGLDGARLKATLGEVKQSGDSATAALSLRWEVPQIGRLGIRVEGAPAPGR